MKMLGEVVYVEVKRKRKNLDNKNINKVENEESMDK